MPIPAYFCAIRTIRKDAIDEIILLLTKNSKYFFIALIRGLLLALFIMYSFSSTLLIIQPGVEAPAVTSTYFEFLNSSAFNSSSVSI